MRYPDPVRYATDPKLADIAVKDEGYADVRFRTQAAKQMEEQMSKPVHHRNEAIAIAEVPIMGTSTRLVPVTVVSSEPTPDGSYTLTVETNDGNYTRLSGLFPWMVSPLQPQVDYTGWIGQKVRKARGHSSDPNLDREPKPFKSGLKVNTVKAITKHPVLGSPAFAFEEDDSVVECRRCHLTT